MLQVIGDRGTVIIKWMNNEGSTLTKAENLPNSRES